jgi:hypothetical protein
MTSDDAQQDEPVGGIAAAGKYGRARGPMARASGER